MTKQEEIREGIGGCVRAVRNDRSPQIECLFKAATDNILAYLHSQGVVIKVDRELPENPHRRSIEEEGIPEDKWNERIARSNIVIHDDAQQGMLKADYVAVEPLVKEVSNG